MKKILRDIKSAVSVLIAICLSLSGCFFAAMPVLAEEPAGRPAGENSASSDWPAPPELFSLSAILIDADTGAILYEKNAHEKAYPASTTKMLTGLLTIENCNLEEIVTASYAAASSVTYEDANIGTKVGEQYTVEEALYALLLYSANEVAYMLAEHVGGDLPAFTTMMNKRAEELGALNTHFNNASGLYDPLHYTTAYDLAMIGRGCLNNASFVSFDSYADVYTLAPTNKTATSRTLYHRHKMLKGRAYYYEYCKGGKTGFTDESQYTLVTFAEKDGVRLVCVVLKSGDNQRFEDTKKLFDYGFSKFARHTISESDISTLFSNSNYFHSNVFGSNDINFSMSSATIQLPHGVDASQVEMKIDTDNSADILQNLTAKVQFMYDNHLVGTSALSLSASSGNSDGLLPLVGKQQTTLYKQRHGIIINVWFLLTVIFAIFSLYWVRNIYLNNRELKRRRRGRKLRF